MLNKFYKLIEVAQKVLAENPYDLGHDLNHHYNVYDNVYHIILNENIIKINWDLVTVAAWWHDVDRDNNKHPRFTLAAKSLSIDDEVLEQIINIINTHSFTDRRSQSIEGKVLFDADKIEYANPTRWIHIDKAIIEGKMDLDRALKYGEALNNRIADVYQSMTFNYSKARLTENIRFLIVAKKQGLFSSKINQEIDWDILESLVEKGK